MPFYDIHRYLVGNFLVWMFRVDTHSLKIKTRDKDNVPYRNMRKYCDECWDPPLKILFVDFKSGGDVKFGRWNYKPVEYEEKITTTETTVTGLFSSLFVCLLNCLYISAYQLKRVQINSLCESYLFFCTSVYSSRIRSSTLLYLLIFKHICIWNETRYFYGNL